MGHDHFVSQLAPQSTHPGRVHPGFQHDPALDSEESSMLDLIGQSNPQVLNFVDPWRNADIRQKQELQWALFPDSLTYSHEKRFSEPGIRSASVFS
jgi:hypothetical protein